MQKQVHKMDLEILNDLRDAKFAGSVQGSAYLVSGFCWFWCGFGGLGQGGCSFVGLFRAGSVVPGVLVRCGLG